MEIEDIYIYIYMVRARHFCSAGPVVRNVGGASQCVMCRNVSAISKM